MRKPPGVHSIWDNGGETADRYTVYFKLPKGWKRPGYFPCLVMSESPFHPQGIGLHDEGMPGDHNGRRIRFSSLPVDCQRAVMNDLEEVQ